MLDPPDTETLPAPPSPRAPTPARWVPPASDRASRGAGTDAGRPPAPPARRAQPDGRPPADRRPGPPPPARARRPSPLIILIAAAFLVAVGLIVVLDAGGSPTPIKRDGALLPDPRIAAGPTGRVSLDGPWTVASDPGDGGVRMGYSTGAFGGQTLSVPAVVNALPITGDAGVVSYAGSLAWYRTSFTLPHAGAYALRFESVNHRALVWLDGHLLGSHIGTYLPFEERFAASAGTHTLVVKADWRSPDVQSREGFHRTWFNFGGLNREVSLRPIGPSEILAPSLHTTLTSHGATVDVGIQVHNNGPARDLGVSGTLSHSDQQVDLRFPRRHLAHGASTTLRTSVNVSSPALWAPGQPNLYDLKLQVGDESAYRARVGLRQVSWPGGHLYLNGHPLLLRGASLQEDILGHGDALTPRDQDALVAGLRSIGANATRAQHPLDAGLLQRLDAAGIVVLEGVGPVDPPGAWISTTPVLLHRAEARVRVTVRQDRLHPSIIGWNLANEVAGNGHSGGQAQYIDHVARELHRTDPGRMVAVDLWGEHPPRIAGALYSHLDAIGVTNYEGWYEDTLAPAATVVGRIRARVDSLTHTFAGKVLIISEFGAEANGANPTTSPGGYAFQARLLGEHIDVYRQMPALSGMLVWDLRDFAVAPTFAGGSIHRTAPGIQLVKGLNQKGLLDYLGRPKPAATVVRQAFADLGRRAG